MSHSHPHSPSPDRNPPQGDGSELAFSRFGSHYRVQFGVDIEDDRVRYRDIARGKIREDLGKYMAQDGIIAQKGKETIKIPLPRIDNPHFETQSGNGEGVGQGDGDPGDSIGKGKPQKGKGDKGDGAGEEDGNHIYEEVSLQELADMMGEALHLPRIEPKGSRTIPSEKGRYNTISRSGPPALRHARRTLKEALKRAISGGDYDPDEPSIIPEREDFRYKDFRPDPKPEFNACIVYVMDVSGSMESGQKDIARKISFWIDLWLQRQYDNVDRVFIIHDSSAKEVDEQEFFTTNATGGTKISSAYEAVTKVMERYPESEWNMYMFQFSDGDNMGSRDDDLCVEMMKSKILPRFNQVAYGQIPTQGGWGSSTGADTAGFYKTLRKHFADEENFVQTPVADETKILEAIKSFFSDGH